jgi:hypothetical protein
MTPGDKLGLVKAHQAVGQRVLVTGGGLHDSPALTCAEAGLAMGSSGSGASTDLARESAGVVLTRDDFRSVVSAIAESRRSLSNLAVSVRFYLSGKVALLLLFLASLVLGLDMPLSPLHVILVATLADTGASLAFANAPAEPDLMVQAKAKAANRWGSNTFMAGLRFAFASVGLGALLMLLAVGGVLLGAHQLVLVETHESSSGHHHDSAADASALLDLEGETSAFEAAKNAGTSAATPNTHASSTFFPEGLLAPFRRDKHLALTQSLVLLGWMVASALLALFVRGSDGAGGCGRSSWFACCDRRSVHVLRARQRQLREQDELLARARRSASGEDDDEYARGSSVSSLSPRSALSVAMHAGRAQGYDSLSQAEEGGLGAHRAFLAAPSSSSKQPRTKDGARKEASERKSSSSALLLDDSSTLSDGDDSDASSSSAAGGGASAAAPEQIEGLHKPRTRASSMNKHASITRSVSAAASSPVLPDASLFALVFPLFAHPALLLWCFATLLVGVLCTTTLAASVPALHEALHLAPVDVYVRLPSLFGEEGPAVAAWWIAVAPPVIVFFVAELVKFVCSWCLRAADNECALK